MDNSDLRKEAICAITNYIHHELFEAVSTTPYGKNEKMLPLYEVLAESQLCFIDSIIESTKFNIMNGRKIA